jgi:chromosome segregation ATPase
MYEALLSTVLPATAIAALAMALAMSRRELGRVQGRLALLEQRAAEADQGQVALAGQLAAAQRELASAVAATQRLHFEQSELAARMEVLETQGASEQPYGDAIRMVRQGAREGRLVDELGLSPIEAALIVRLHGAAAAH